MRAEDRLLNLWRTRSPMARCLLPLAWLYRALWSLRRRLFDAGWLRSQRLPVPVLVVGNVVAGGAGKTPLVIELLAHLQRAGWRPAVVSRGHGRASQQTLQVHAATDARDCGDEPWLIFRRAGVPVCVGRDRAAAARALIAAHPQVNLIVCDDGLQHLRLARDAEICVFDARGVGNGWLLPAGPLREPWPRHAAVPGWTVQSVDDDTDADAAPWGWPLRRSLAPEAVRADGSRRALADLAREPCVALAAIAHPERFFAMLRAAGVGPVQTIALADHHPMEPLDAPIRNAAVLVCTEKDAAKLWRTRPDAWAVPLQVSLQGPWLDELTQALARARL